MATPSIFPTERWSVTTGSESPIVSSTWSPPHGLLPTVTSTRSRHHGHVHTVSSTHQFKGRSTRRALGSFQTGSDLLKSISPDFTATGSGPTQTQDLKKK
uniref:Uncharacterized protein n=1 Tax=Knipowitschia caucasica TaxID=637954 RepID=A0AAV2KKB7_KNICA